MTVIKLKIIFRMMKEIMKCMNSSQCLKILKYKKFKIYRMTILMIIIIMKYNLISFKMIFQIINRIIKLRNKIKI